MPAPQTKTQFSASLGLSGKKFIKDYSTMALLLTDLTKKVQLNLL